MKMAATGFLAQRIVSRTIPCHHCRTCPAISATLQQVQAGYNALCVAPTLRSSRSLSVIMRAAEEVDDYDPELDAMERMDKSILACEKELVGIRAGRANPAMLSTVQVDYYGAPTPLQNLATISTPDAQTLMIKPFDKGSIKEIEDAIMNSGLGFTPNNDGNVIRINVPQLTEERRKELVKLCNSEGENAKVAVRNVRRDVLKKVEKMELPEDDLKGTQGEIQTLTDSYIEKIEELVSKKNKELTTV